MNFWRRPQERRKEEGAAEAGWSEGCRPLGDMRSLFASLWPTLGFCNHYSPLLSFQQDCHSWASVLRECIFGFLAAAYSSSCNFQWERENKKVIDISFCPDQSNIGKREEGKGLGKHTRTDFASSLGVIPLIYSFSECLLNAHRGQASILGLSRRNEPVREGLSFTELYSGEGDCNKPENKWKRCRGSEYAGRGKTLEAHVWLAFGVWSGRTVISDQSPEGCEGSVL